MSGVLHLCNVLKFIIHRFLFYSNQTLLQYYARFGAHIEQKIYDAQIGEKTQTGVENLIVWHNTETRIFLKADLRTDKVAAVFNLWCWSLDIFRGGTYIGRQHEQFTNLGLQSIVEINQIFVGFFIEWAKIVLIIRKIRALFVGRHQSGPMQTAPTAVIANTQVAHGLIVLTRTNNGDGQCQRPVARCDNSSVAISLLDIMIATFGQYLIGSIEAREILNGREIRGGE